MKRSYINYALLLTVFCLLGTVGFAQSKVKSKSKSKNYKYKYEFCSNNNSWSSDKVSVKDLRESTLTAGDIKVISKNGRITVKGENRSDILLRACVSAWSEKEADAQAIVDSIRVETSGDITADVPKDSNASVSYEILVPTSTNLDLFSNNGRITISNVQSQMNFETRNGRITLDGVNGNIKGRTQNGRVTVKLAGNSWQGNGLDVETSNGRITLYMPRTFAANVEVGTNNGRFSSNFEELQIPRNADGKRRRYGANKVNTSVNGGGAPIRLVTNNGRVTINSN